MTLKVIGVGFIIFCLLLPVSLISELVNERLQRRDKVVNDVGESWSGPQSVSGPVLEVPVRSKPGHHLYILPERLEIAGEAETEARARSIFQTVVYTAKLQLEGEFGPPDLENHGLKAADVDWQGARILLGISDLRGVKERILVEAYGQKAELRAGGMALGPGLHARLERLEVSSRSQFRIPVQLRGSRNLRFAPLGRTTTVSLTSKWPSPSFQGAFLPESRSVSDAGFAAHWKILDVNRSLAQSWLGAAPDLAPHRFGFDLLTPADHYAATSRATKYAVLYIFLTFLCLFFVEYFVARRLHPIQYLLVGSGLVIFYLLLLSLSEHIGFQAAYLLASIGIIGIISGYLQGVLRMPRVTASVGGILIVLYGFLYTLLQLEDYALLLGSLGLFATLGLVMYITRDIDFYAVESRI